MNASQRNEILNKRVAEYAEYGWFIESSSLVWPQSEL